MKPAILWMIVLIGVAGCSSTPERCFRKDSGGIDTLRARYFRLSDGEECGYYAAKDDDLWEAKNDGYGGGGYVHYFQSEGHARLYVEAKCPIK